jgi:hypothetical protein
MYLYLLIGCLHGLFMKISLKYGLHIANTSLWHCNNWPSHAIVQSTKSPRSNRLWKPDDKFSANFNLFQHSANSSMVYCLICYFIFDTKSRKFKYFFMSTNILCIHKKYISSEIIDKFAVDHRKKCSYSLQIRSELKLFQIQTERFIIKL